MWKALKISLGLVLLLIVVQSLTGCANLRATSAPVVGDSFCAVAQIITVSKSDNLTPETARQILAHDQKVKALCTG